VSAVLYEDEIGKMEKLLARWRTRLAALWLYSQRWEAIRAITNTCMRIG
jgi:hypothetical protein